MKKKAVARMLAAALAGVLGVSTLTGCTFGFASDPDDPNETKKEIPIDTSKDTFAYDSSLEGTKITLLNSRQRFKMRWRRWRRSLRKRQG